MPFSLPIHNLYQPVDPGQHFPPGFVWGVATSSFQIEGAAQADGKGESIWDRFCRMPGAIADASDGSVACEHYIRCAEDLDLIAKLGVNAYRFSTSWPRVQPTGSGAWNEKGLDFYDRLVDGLLARGIAPYLTLNHWDLPEALQAKGGWANRDTAQHFVDYALGMHARLGDRVASIATHNEPWVMSVLGHETGIFAPGIKHRATAMQVAHHLMLSHGMALQAMRGLGLKTAMGIVLNLSPIYPASDDPKDIAKAKHLSQRLLNGLKDIEQVFINGHLTQRVPHNLNISFNYVEGESLIMGIKGLAVSSGSACTSASLEPSYVLRALGRSDELAHSSLRMTIGRYTTTEEIDYVVTTLRDRVARLRDLSPLWDMYQEGVDISSIQWAAH